MIPSVISHVPVALGRRPIPEFPSVAVGVPREDQSWVRDFCMVRCRRPDGLVIQIGTVAGDGMHMPFMCCRDCLQELTLLLDTHTKVRDGLYRSDELRKLNDRFIALRSA